METIRKNVSPAKVPLLAQGGGKEGGVVKPRLSGFAESRPGEGRGEKRSQSSLDGTAERNLFAAFKKPWRGAPRHGETGRH